MHILLKVATGMLVEESFYKLVSSKEGNFHTMFMPCPHDKTFNNSPNLKFVAMKLS